MNSEHAKKLGLKARPTKPLKMRSANGQLSRIDQAVSCDMDIGGVPITVQDVLLVPNLSYDMILGMDEMYGRKDRKFFIVPGAKYNQVEIYVSGGRKVRAARRKDLSPALPRPMPCMSASSALRLRNDELVMYVNTVDTNVPKTDVMVVQMEDGLAMIKGNALEELYESSRQGEQFVDVNSFDHWNPQLDRAEPIAGTEVSKQDDNLLNPDSYKDVAISDDLEPKVREQISKLCEEYKEVFGGASKEVVPPYSKKGIHSITLVPGADIDSIAEAPRRMAPQQRKAMVELVTALREAGRIVPTTGKATSAPVMVSKKASSGKQTGWRCAIDFRKLNSMTERDDMPMPRIDRLVDWFKEYRYHSTLDGLSQFYQMRLDEKSSQLCTTQFGSLGLFRWLCAPFGLKTLPATVQRHHQEMLRDCPNMDVYLDDFLIGSCHQSEEDDQMAIVRDLRKILEILKDHRITIKASKCKLGYKSIEVLGHTVSYEKCLPIASKVRAFQESAAPRNKAELVSFLAMVRYYMEFYPHLHDDIEYFQLKTRAHGNSFVWSDDDQTKFETLKEGLGTAMPLFTLDPTLPVHVQSDWSRGGCGVVLMQRPSESAPPRMLAAARMRLKGAQLSYSASEGELQAVRWALKKYAHLLIGQKVIWDIDHKPLLTLLTTARSNNVRLTRTALEMQNFDIDLHYKPGSENGLADYLSRYGAKLEDGEERWQKFISQPTFQNAFTNVVIDEEDIIETESEDNTVFPCAVVAATVANVPETLEDFQLSWKSWVDADDALKPYVQCATKATGFRDQPARIRKAVRAVAPMIDEHGFLRVGTGQDEGAYIVPEAGRAWVLKDMHSLTHASTRPMIEQMMGRFWWPTRRRDTEWKAKKCSICQAARDHREPKAMGQIAPDAKPWEVVCLDLMTPKQLDKQAKAKFMAILVLLDVASGLVRASILPSKKSEDVVAAYLQMTSAFGAPEIAVFDAGTEFRAAFETVLETQGVKAAPTSPKDHVANGMVERMNKTLGKLVGKFLMKKFPLEVALQLAVLAVNETMSRSRGMAPKQFFLMGRGRTYLQRKLGDNMVDLAPAMDSMFDKQVEQFEQRVQDANDKRRQVHLQNKKLYQRTRRQDTEYSKGDAVRVRLDDSLTSQSKLLRRVVRWKPGYTVLRKVGSQNRSLILRDPAGGEIQRSMRDVVPDEGVDVMGDDIPDRADALKNGEIDVSEMLKTPAVLRQLESQQKRVQKNKETARKKQQKADKRAGKARSAATKQRQKALQQKALQKTTLIAKLKKAQVIQYLRKKSVSFDKKLNLPQLRELLKKHNGNQPRIDVLSIGIEQENDPPNNRCSVSRTGGVDYVERCIRS